MNSSNHKTVKQIYLGTITSKVVKYSLSKIKCSFFTKSAKFLVNKLPLCNNYLQLLH